MATAQSPGKKSKPSATKSPPSRQWHLQVARGGRTCDTQLADLLLTTHAQEPHLSLGFRAHCKRQGALTLSGTLFFDTNTTQRTLISAENARRRVHLDPLTRLPALDGAPGPFDRQRRSPPSSAKASGTCGLATTTWPSCCSCCCPACCAPYQLGGWQAVPTFRETARDLFRIITAFTLAHSLTLAFAATGAVNIPVRPVEVAIAASIVIAGMLNLFPGAARARLALAFGFGLVHGFGFANALAELGARGARLVPTLAGFNMGVELAQLSLVLLVLPFLFRARKSAFTPGVSCRPRRSGPQWPAPHGSWPASACDGTSPASSPNA